MRWFAHRNTRRVASLLLGAAHCLFGFSPPLIAADLVAIPELGLRVARGFRVSLFADSDLANDIYAMTLDARGQVVVTGQGYIRTLLDTDGDGAADTSRLFATTTTGGMGLCFDGADLYFTGDGALLRYTDGNGDGVADEAPQRLLPLNFAEHGGHAPRKGPDGWWHVIAGNETSFTNDHVTLPHSPIRQPEGGALLRLSPDGTKCEITAQGFRNPYDFDFNWLGDVFTCDSDVEADFFLPWYAPTRFYHVGHGAHHGWRLPGWTRSWPRPDYYADTVDMLAPTGRGSPTGVVCYRHYQFPPYYQNGMFGLDWTFGRIFFLPLRPDGASYQAAPEVFLEPLGTHGFAPTDAVVAPDGSLLVAIGGRRTRGAVYRIEWADAGRAFLATNWLLTARSEVEAVLNAPQPLDAWSRDFWEPAATRLGPQPFALAVANNQLPPAWRVRAVEILTELFGGLPTTVAGAGAQANSPFVRARVAWSLGRAPCEKFFPLLLALAKDPAPLARRCAMEALGDRAPELSIAEVQQALAANLPHTDKRIRLATARLATFLSDTPWKALWQRHAGGDPQTRLTLALASMWRNPQTAVHAAEIETALAVLTQSKDPDLRLQALRLVILGLGDFRLQNPSREVFTAYEPAHLLDGHSALVRQVRQGVRPALATGDATVNFEAARVLAMVEDDAPETPGKILSFITDKSPPDDDFHYLAVLSRLASPPPTNSGPRIAHAILSLDRKLAGLEQRNKQNWPMRLAEVAQTLLRRDPQLAAAFLRHPGFAAPGHVHLAASLGAEHYLPAARLFFAATQKQPDFAWSGPLIDLLAALPPEEVRPVLRKQWGDLALRDELLLKLAPTPDAADRDRFITGLASLRPDVARASLTALLQLPRKDPAGALLPALRLLRRLLNEPNQRTLREQLIAFLNRQTGQAFRPLEDTPNAAGLKTAYQPVFDWCARAYPFVARQVDNNEQDDPAQWNLLLKAAPWERGDAARGEAIYRERGCQTCHARSTPLGPDLRGVTGRFSPEDLFHAIIFPSRDVAPPYRTTIFQTRDGQTHSGIVAYESAEGVIVQTGATSTVRLSAPDIVSRQPSALSLMPAGLLAGLRAADLADLYGFLKTLPAGR